METPPTTSATVEIHRPARRRRRFRPTTTWLMGAIVVVAGWLGWIANSARTQRLAIEALHRLARTPGGQTNRRLDIRYLDHVKANSGRRVFDIPEIRSKPSWIGKLLRRQLDSNYFDQVAALRAYSRDSKTLAAIGSLSGLRILELWPNSENPSLLLDDDLTVIQRLNRLETLTISMGQFSDSGMSRLSGLHQLELLDLVACEIEESGFRHLSDLPRLRLLMLTACSIEGKGLRHLGTLTQVQKLVITSSEIGEEDLAGLVGMTSLQELDLWQTTIDDASLLRLTKLQSLKVVDLRRSRGLTQDGVDRFRQAMPQSRVTFP